MRQFLLLIALSFACLIASAQEEEIILFQNLSNEEGLSQGTVRGITQDETGFIWIATAEGLHRYDGYSFKVYKHDLRDSHSVASNNLTTLAGDPEGRLWVGTDAGEVDVFDRRTAVFHHLQLQDTSEETNHYPITSIFHHESGITLIGLDGGGVVMVDRLSEKVKRFTNENSALPNNYVTCFAKETDRSGIWVGTQQGIALFNTESGVFKQLSSLELFSNQNISGIFHGISRVYFTTRGQGLQIWETATDEITRIPSPRIRNARIQTFIMMDDRGALWIGTDGGGLLKFTGDKYVNYRNQPYIPTSLIGDNLECGFMDRDGNLWFGTRNGISRFDRSLKVFELIRDFQHDGEATNRNIYCIYEGQDGTIWLGTLTGGLAKFDPKTKKLVVYPTIHAGNIETRAVRSIFQDKKGILWVGTRDEGLFSFDTEKEIFTHHPTDDNIKLNTIRDIYEDSEGMLWLATKWGLMNYDRTTGKYLVYKTQYLNNNPIYQIYEDKTRNELMLVTFRSGLHIFNKKDRAFTVLSHSEDSNAPSTNAMMVIQPMGNDSFMIGTYGGGVNIFDRKNLTFTSVTTEDGLPNNVIYGILRNGSNEYWLSTNHGLCRWRRSTNEFRNFNLSHYLQGLEFNEGAYCKASDGTFYFGGPNGFNYFDPNHLGLNDRPPTVALTSFKIMDKDVELGTDINFVKEIEISYRENLISFEYAALSYTNSKDNEYAYKMEGYDNDWIYAGNRRSAYYTKLEPGTYTFRVKAANSNGSWNDVGTSIQVIIHPPYYLTWWFIVLMSLFLLGLIILLFRMRTKAISRRYEHRLTDMELSSLRSQMNPHFIFNSLNSIQYFVLNKEPEAAYNYLTKFSSLMRMILQNSRLKYISLESEYQWLTTYLELEKMRMDENFEYEIKMDPQMVPAEIMIPSMLVQPYVENAIIHGLMHKEGDRRLEISFSLVKRVLICTIKDNGVGREASREINKNRTRKHKSHGMNLTRERLEIIGQNHKRKPELKIIDLRDGNGESAGTKVVITIPIGDVKE